MLWVETPLDRLGRVSRSTVSPVRNRPSIGAPRGNGTVVANNSVNPCRYSIFSHHQTQLDMG